MAEQGGKVEPRNIAHGFLGWVGGMHRSFSILFLSVLVVTGCSATRSKHSPYYKQVPQWPFSLTASDMTQLKADGRLSDTVESVLVTRVRSSMRSE